MQVRIDDIRIRKRVRKDLGDLSQLMESMKKFGLLSPIIVNGKRELIAGHRRLEAARRLGWKTVTVSVVNRESDLEKLEMEIEENIQRKEFTPDELAEGYVALEKLKNPGFFLRIWLRLKALFRRLFRRTRRP